MPWSPLFAPDVMSKANSVMTFPKIELLKISANRISTSAWWLPFSPPWSCNGIIARQRAASTWAAFVTLTLLTERDMLGEPAVVACCEGDAEADDGAGLPVPSESVAHFSVFRFGVLGGAPLPFLLGASGCSTGLRLPAGILARQE